MDSPDDRDVAAREAAFEERFKKACQTNATVHHAVMMIEFGVPPVRSFKAACVCLAEQVEQMMGMICRCGPAERVVIRASPVPAGMSDADLTNTEFAEVLHQQIKSAVMEIPPRESAKPVEVKAGQTVCGTKHLELLNSLTFDVPSERRAFVCGFMVGQAEKVFLGACDAAMFRPSPERLDTVRSAVTAICEVYGLRQMELTVSTGVERWIFRDDATAGKLLDLQRTEENSPEWHARRARLCGIPAAQVDPRFHERAGYGEKCY